MARLTPGADVGDSAGGGGPHGDHIARALGGQKEEAGPGYIPSSRPALEETDSCDICEKTMDSDGHPPPVCIYRVITLIGGPLLSLHVAHRQPITCQ